MIHEGYAVSIEEEPWRSLHHELISLFCQCDACGVEPIIGVRYKCTVCDVSEEIDLCSKCMAVGTFANGMDSIRHGSKGILSLTFGIDYHTPDHPFEAIRTANALPYYADNDYVTPEYLGEYSYLGY